MKHVCEVPDPKFEFVHRMTGVVGEEARNILMRFIKEEQDNCWKWVSAEEVEAEEEIQSPVPGLKSVVVKLTDPARNPRPRKEKRAPSPVPLDEPDDIMLEEPPRKVRITETEPGFSLLQDLFCSSSESGSTICEMEDSCIGSEDSSVTFQKQTEVREENREENSVTKQSEPNDKQENAKEDENVILTVECEKPTKSDAEKQTDAGKGKEIKIDKKKEMITKSKKEKSVKKLTEKEKSSDSRKDEQSDKNVEKEKYMKGKDQVRDKGKGQDKQSDRNKVNKGEKSKGAENLKGNKRDEKEKSRGNKSNEKVKSKGHSRDNQENKDAVKLRNSKKSETEDEHKENQIHQHKANEKQNDNEKEHMRNENLGSEEQSSAEKGNQAEIVEISEKCTETSGNTKTQSCEKMGKQMIVLQSKHAENERQKQKLTQIEVKQANSDKVIEKQKNVNVDSKDEQNESNKKQKDKQNEKRKEGGDGEVIDLLGDKMLEMNESSLKEASNKENDSVETMNKKEGELCTARDEKRKNKDNGNSASENGNRKITIEEYAKRKEKQIDYRNQKVEERMEEHLTNRKVEQTAGGEKLKEVFTLDNIINEMTLTREGMQCLSPIREMSPERNLESPLPVIEESDTEETTTQEVSTEELTTAVESINNSTLDRVYDQAGDIISNCAVGLIEELVLEAEIDSYVDKAESLADYEFRKEEERRKAEKQNRKRKHSEIVEVESVEGVTELDEDLQTLQKMQESKVVLDVGGVKFETSIVTLKRDPNSLFAKLFTKDSPVKPQGNTIFLDRDASHFRLILNYLRNGCQIVNVATLPRERRYLLELKEECRYYRLRGLRKIISKRLKHLEQIYGMEY